MAVYSCNLRFSLLTLSNIVCTLFEGLTEKWAQVMTKVLQIIMLWIILSQGQCCSSKCSLMVILCFKGLNSMN